MLIDEWDRIKKFQEAASKHKYKFAPFHNLTLEEYNETLEFATTLLKPIKETVFDI